MTQPNASRNPRHILVLAIAAGLILSLGWFLKPGERVAEPVAADSQAEPSRLPARRELEEMADFFGELASDLAPALVRLRNIRQSGVVWSHDMVVTARLAWRFPAAITVAASQGDLGSYTDVAGPHLPLAAMRTPRLVGRTPPSRRRAAAEVETGNWVLAIWQTESEPAFAPGNALGTESRACGDRQVHEMVTTISIQPAMLGGGVFDLDGNLLAVLLRCDGHDIAVAAASVDDLLAEGQTHQSRVLARWGLTIEPLLPDESFHFGLRGGLMVRELWERYPAEATGVRPGDILMSLDGALLDSVNDLRILEGDEAPGQETFRLEARRGKTTVTIDLPARGIDLPLDTVEPESAGLVWDQPVAGYLIESVVAGSRAAKAGVRAGDRLVRVDHAEADRFAAVQAVLSEERDEPTFVELARDGRVRGVLLP